MSTFKTHSQFLQELKLLHPDLIMMSNYERNNKFIIVKDSSDILYKVTPTNILRGFKPTIRTALNKDLAFKIKLKQIQPELRIISEYRSSKEDIIVIDKYGIEYKTKPQELLRGTVPNIRTALNKNLALEIASNIVHDNKYTYESVNYIKDKENVIINCIEHGDFLQKPYKHLQGYGCPVCSKFNYPGPYCSVYKYRPTTEIYIYLMHLYNSNENFYKVGLSNNPLKRQYDFPYKVKILSYYKSTISELYPIEQAYHEKFKEMKINYIPQRNFAGWTECFGYGIQ